MFLNVVENTISYTKLSIKVVYLCMQIDSNTDGLVDFSEFVAATVHVNQLEEHNSEKWQQRSKAAFEKFDVDGDGFITPEEIKLVSWTHNFLDET